MTTLLGHSAPIRSVISNENGYTIFTSSDDWTIGKWDLKGNMEGFMIGHQGAVNTLAMGRFTSR